MKDKKTIFVKNNMIDLIPIAKKMTDEEFNLSEKRNSYYKQLILDFEWFFRNGNVL